MKNSRRKFLRNTALGISSIPAVSFIGKSNDNQSLNDISSFLHYIIHLEIRMYFQSLSRNLF